MLITQNIPIVLASTSKIRKRILSTAGLDFKVIKSPFNEDEEKEKFPDFSPQELATFLAKQKAIEVSKIHSKTIVIGADQVCELDGKELFKSLNPEDALEQLKKINGKRHFQNNCSVIAFDGEIIFESFCRVELKMRNLSIMQLKKYVETEKSWGCAGSYKYESLGKHLFEKVDGDYFAVLGLNIQPLLHFMHQFNFITI